MSNSSLKPFKQTVSLCPECYRRIPAWIFLTDDGVIMKKACCDHGETVSVVERDVGFYLQCLESAAPTIYAGYFIDITEKCNLKCKYCYYPVDNKKKDRLEEGIVQDATLHRHLAPFIITGGEPSLNPRLVEIVERLKEIGPVELLTNGTNLKESNMKHLVPLLSVGGTANINLSYHSEIKDDNIRFLTLCRSMGIKLESVLFVIDDVSQIDGILEFCDEWQDVIAATRIKAATKVWDEQQADNKIFVSDMLKYMQEKGAVVTWWRHNKVSFVTTKLNGAYHMLVSWYDRFNVDILDIGCAPYYQAKTGEVMNILTAMLINEGIQQGWLNGNKIRESIR